MKVEEFPVSTDHGKADFEKFTSTHCIDHIATTSPTAHTRWATVYYNDSDQEQVRLAAHMAIANECASNYEFNQLRSQRARELWLLATWGVPTLDARDVIELAGDGFLTVRVRGVTLD